MTTLAYYDDCCIMIDAVLLFTLQHGQHIYNVKGSSKIISVTAAGNSYAVIFEGRPAGVGW